MCTRIANSSSKAAAPFGKQKCMVLAPGEMGNVIIDKESVTGDVVVRLENEYDLHNVSYGLPSHHRGSKRRSRCFGQHLQKRRDVRKGRVHTSQRCVTTLVEMKSGGVASCKTSATIPKERIFDVVKFVGTLKVGDDVKIGDVVAKTCSAWARI